MLGGRTPAFDRVSGPPIAMSDVSTRADAHKVPGLRAASALPCRRCAPDATTAARQTPSEPENRRASRTPEHYNSVTTASTACVERPSANTIYCGEKCITFGKRPAALTASDESERLRKRKIWPRQTAALPLDRPPPGRHSPPAKNSSGGSRKRDEALSPADSSPGGTAPRSTRCGTPAATASWSATTRPATPITAPAAARRTRRWASSGAG